MLDKYEYDESPMNYINRAKNSGYAYFDLGEDWSLIQKRYDLTNDDMFKLFNEPFLDDGINYGKTFHFSHDPRIDTGFLNDEYNYLLKNGYEFIDEEGAMVCNSKITNGTKCQMI